MSNVIFDNASVEIPIFNSQGRSLKKAVLGLATGGRIGLTESGKTVVKCLNNITLQVGDNERVGIIGCNGSGKTTLLRVLGKVYKPTSGTAKINGEVGSLIDISLGIDGEATGIENIYLRAALLGIPKTKVTDALPEIVDFTQLGNFIHMPVRTYSSGMHLRLAFAVSTMIKPEILIMDEWLSVGDIEFQNRAENKLNNLINQSNILFIATHSPSLIKKCCNRVLWLDQGCLKMDGTPDEVCPKYFGSTY